MGELIIAAKIANHNRWIVKDFIKKIILTVPFQDKMLKEFLENGYDVQAALKATKDIKPPRR